VGEVKLTNDGPADQEENRPGRLFPENDLFHSVLQSKEPTNLQDKFSVDSIVIKEREAKITQSATRRRIT
jgi:hypothetical protein